MTFVDLTDLYEARSELQLAASVFTSAREGIVVTSPAGIILAANDAFLALTGHSRDALIGTPIGILRSGKEPSSLYEEMWNALVAHGHWRGEIRNRRADGTEFTAFLTIGSVRTPSGALDRYVALYTDLTAEKQREAEMTRLADHDRLTGLPNRNGLVSLLDALIRDADTQPRRVAVAYLDLDDFARLNEALGPQEGDRILTTIAGRLLASLRTGDLLARPGGDEFVAVLQEHDGEDVLARIRRLQRHLAQPMTLGKDTASVEVSACVGVSQLRTDDAGIDADQLLRRASHAMYRAKLAGRGQVHLFDPEADRTERGRFATLQSIQHGLDRDEFVLHYQPKVHMRTGEILGMEALVRWQHPERGLLAPGTFLPAIEHEDISIALGDRVILRALDQMQRWNEAGHSIPVSVNVGSRQLADLLFPERLEEQLQQHPGVQPRTLELEILETGALEDMARVEQLIRRCHALGVTFALDDFGTGFSSLSYLKTLPARTLKIDRSFVLGLLDDPQHLAICQSILELARIFDRQVIAEGIETLAHGERLLSLGCELGQGYAIARPMPPDDVLPWCKAWRTPEAWQSAPPAPPRRRPTLPPH